VTEPEGERRDQEPDAGVRGSVTDRDERYQQLVMLAPDGILIHDGERIVFANAAALRLAGATHPDQLVGLTIDTVLNPPFLKGVQTQLLRSGDLSAFVPPVRDRFRRLDGSGIEVEVTAIPFFDHGHPAAHLVVRDITERLVVQQAAQQAEEYLQQAQKMEAVGVLAGGVAHEVNNMMCVILGFTEFLFQDPAMPATLRSDVGEIVKAADRAAAVTRQLLAFSRRALRQPQRLDLGAAVHDLEPVIRRLLGEGRQFTLASDASPQVWADKGQLEQVIVNLALNARDAMPSGGTLTITTAETELPNGVDLADGSAIPAGRYALRVVRDTGAGMDAATQARIFEPVFTTKPVGEGTGLGLAAAYGIMKQHKGHIAVTSAPGEGTAFTLYLPVFFGADVVERPEEPEPRPSGVAPTQRGATILVVEDEWAVLEIATRSLRSAGFRVLQASEGAGALEMVDRHGPPHLVLTDMMMPGIGGAELARRLEERWPALPVLFMSGYSAEDLRRQGAVGVERVMIQKPFTPAGLVRSVAAALSQVRRR
jgi:PAS domain S-box-containing protein